jgi:hypothetical protein
MNTDLATFKITAGSRPRVIINDEDVTGALARFAIEQDGRQSMKVGLVLRDDFEGTIEGEGIVTVLVPGDQSQVVAEWLANIDGAVLSREVLASASLDGQDPIELAVQILRSWVSGTPART